MELMRSILMVVEMFIKFVAVAGGLFGALAIAIEWIPVPSEKTVAIFAFLAFAGACLSLKTIGDDDD